MGVILEKEVSASRVEMTQVVLPQFANAIGTVFGGQVLSWIDICAAVSAQRHARVVSVTASIDSVHFMEPIKQGYIIVLKSQVNAVFGSSMEIGVKVISENPLTGESIEAARAYCTFVAISKDGKPVKVNGLKLVSNEDLRRNKEALARRKARLEARKAEFKHHEKLNLGK